MVKSDKKHVLKEVYHSSLVSSAFKYFDKTKGFSSFSQPFCSFSKGSLEFDQWSYTNKKTLSFYTKIGSVLPRALNVFLISSGLSGLYQYIGTLFKYDTGSVDKFLNDCAQKKLLSYDDLYISAQCALHKDHNKRFIDEIVLYDVKALNLESKLRRFQKRSQTIDRCFILMNVVFKFTATLLFSSAIAKLILGDLVSLGRQVIGSLFVFSFALTPSLRRKDKRKRAGYKERAIDKLRYALAKLRSGRFVRLFDLDKHFATEIEQLQQAQSLVLLVESKEKEDFDKARVDSLKNKASNSPLFQMYQKSESLLHPLVVQYINNRAQAIEVEEYIECLDVDQIAEEAIKKVEKKLGRSGFLRHIPAIIKKWFFEKLEKYSPLKIAFLLVLPAIVLAYAPAMALPLAVFAFFLVEILVKQLDKVLSPYFIGLMTKIQKSYRSCLKFRAATYGMFDPIFNCQSIKKEDFPKQNKELQTQLALFAEEYKTAAKPLHAFVNDQVPELTQKIHPSLFQSSLGG